MEHILPAVLIGGPPHAGKSVLFYRLTQALRARHIDHYALRACPDGEGNWFHESPPDLVDILRVKLTGAWPPTFMQVISQALEHRSLPFLVDMGGRPTASEACLLRACTHTILLLRADEPAATRSWQQFVAVYDLQPLAQLYSQPTGTSVISTRAPILQGTLTGLERNAASAGAGAGPLFDELLERIIKLFTSYNLDEWKTRHLERAPTEHVLDVQQALRTFTTSSTTWEPAMLLPLLTRWPESVPLSVYGSGPGWLYATLAAYIDPQPFYLFDPKLPFGWIAPIRVTLDGERTSREDIHIQTIYTQESTLLKVSFPHDRLAYLQPDALIFPPVPVERGLIIDGRIPNWLLTAITRLYKTAGVAWIATFYPPLDQAVIVYTGQEAHRIGNLVSRPAP